MSKPLPAKYHLVGIGGVGMSALAQLLVGMGYGVSGSDRFRDQKTELDALPVLEAQGVRLHPQDGSGVTETLAGLVLSTAIEKDNPDLLKAENLGLPVIHRAELLARLCGDKKCVAVTGTSGKTTVTGMIGWILDYLGADPTVVNGGIVLNWHLSTRIGSIRVGQSDLWVVEADESDKSLLRFKPDWAVITNISKDHFGIGETRELFQKFVSQVGQDIVCGAGVKSQVPRAVEVEPPLWHDEATGAFQYGGYPVRLQVPGRHNVENALLAATLCEDLGYEPQRIAVALSLFKGIHRRLELMGEGGGVKVYDDYAHNPAKIKATLETLKPACHKLIAIWRPHGFSPLSLMMEDLVDVFTRSLRPEDCVYLLPVFYAGGSIKKTVSSDDLVVRLGQQGVQAEGVGSYQALSERIQNKAGKGDTVVCMGARDPEMPVFARRLVYILSL